MPSIEQRELERLRYWQGQLIRSEDFNDQAAVDDQLRWWHNRALHNAYGIAAGMLEGLRVTLTDPAAREFTIRPGVAYDCFGRELILTQERREKLPAEITEGSATLLLQYRATGSVRDIATVCSHSSREVTGPVLKWQSGRFNIRDGVPIASVSDVSKLDSETKIDADRPIARPLARPHIASGRTQADGAGWELWTEKTAGGRFFLGFQIRVDTSAAGFTRIPGYFAWTPTLLVDFIDIADEDINAFTFRLWFPTFTGVRMDNNPFLAFILPALLANIARQVSWIGIETSGPGELTPQVQAAPPDPIVIF